MRSGAGLNVRSGSQTGSRAASRTAGTHALPTTDGKYLPVAVRIQVFNARPFWMGSYELPTAEAVK